MRSKLSHCTALTGCLLNLATIFDNTYFVNYRTLFYQPINLQKVAETHSMTSLCQLQYLLLSLMHRLTSRWHNITHKRNLLLNPCVGCLFFNISKYTKYNNWMHLLEVCLCQPRPLSNTNHFSKVSFDGAF